MPRPSPRISAPTTPSCTSAHGRRSTSFPSSPTSTTSRSRMPRRSRPISSRKLARQHVTVALVGRWRRRAVRRLQPLRAGRSFPPPRSATFPLRCAARAPPPCAADSARRLGPPVRAGPSARCASRPPATRSTSSPTSPPPIPTTFYLKLVSCWQEPGRRRAGRLRADDGRLGSRASPCWCRTMSSACSIAIRSPICPTTS